MEISAPRSSPSIARARSWRPRAGSPPPRRRCDPRGRKGRPTGSARSRPMPSSPSAASSSVRGGRTRRSRSTATRRRPPVTGPHSGTPRSGWRWSGRRRPRSAWPPWGQGGAGERRGRPRRSAARDAPQRGRSLAAARSRFRLTTRSDIGPARRTTPAIPARNRLARRFRADVPGRPPRRGATVCRSQARTSSPTSRRPTRRPATATWRFAGSEGSRREGSGAGRGDVFEKALELRFGKAIWPWLLAQQLDPGSPTEGGSREL